MSTLSFQYRARDPLGNLLQGAIQATSADDASQQLRRDGFQVLEVGEADDPGELFARRISRADIIFLTNQLSVMVETGITLAAALAGIAEQQANPTLRRALNDLRQSVEQGDDFSFALERYPKMFDRTYISLVKVGESTGTLGAMLTRISDYLQKEMETRSKVRAAMAYPTVMLVLATGVTIFLLTYVLPQFTPIFIRRGIDLPTPTKVAVAASDALIGYWYVWLGAAVAAVAGFIFARRTPMGREVIDRARIDAPVIGKLQRKVIISRSVRTLGTMLSSGIPMLDALKLTADISGNVHYARLWRNVHDEVVGGNRMCDVLRTSPLFPATMVQMISAGEETGKLGPVLERISNFCDLEVETAVKSATSLIEPIMISVMGVVVGGIGMALLMPIFSLSRPT